MSLTVVRQFGVVSLLGLPRPGFRSFGVPMGGAFDLESFAIANALVGNLPSGPVWEMGMAHATFRAEQSGTVSVVGALSTIVGHGFVIESSAAFSVEAGDEFTIEAPREGARAYVAFSAGVHKKGWRLRLEEPIDSVANRGELRVVAGPQGASFDLQCLSGPFEISRTINRVGVRLESPIGGHQIELPSEPQCIGTVQVANDGTLIILGPDGPTIGGYPKIAVVATCDLSRVAQMHPGESVRFEVVTVEEARQLAVVARERLQKRIGLIRAHLG